jgi:hypothetical protein
LRFAIARLKTAGSFWRWRQNQHARRVRSPEWEERYTSAPPQLDPAPAVQPKQ